MPKWMGLTSTKDEVAGFKLISHYLSGRVGGRVALEEWKLRLTSAKVEVEDGAELGNIGLLMIQKV